MSFEQASYIYGPLLKQRALLRKISYTVSAIVDRLIVIP